MRDDLPTGTVTFLFTDVEGSTKLLHSLGAEAYAEALAEHRRIVREACAVEAGVEVDTQGDACFFAFPTASGAVAAALAMTEGLAAGPIHLRIGLHTGIPLVTAEGYVGDVVHFAARVAASGHGGQIVLSQATGALLDGQHLTDLGEHRLKDIEGAVSILQVGDKSFPPLKTISNTNLPRPASSFVGRSAELADVLSLIENGSRLVTLTGPGGSGKTRLALEAATALVPSYRAGVFWVGLASLRDPSLVTALISQTIGSHNGLAEHIAERELLLLLDNLEQVIEAAPVLAALLSACPNLALLVTSRELLRVQGEVEYSVPPLVSSEAVSLFSARSRLEPSQEIAELCARLDDLPLALELAAARAKALSPRQILDRLSERLDLLRGGRDADPRQKTLRTTIEWSYGLLSDEEQRLFRAHSVFRGGCTLEAAEEVADADLDTLQSLVEKSLLRFSNERFWMLETLREYARQQLEESGGTDRLRRRHASHFVALAEDAAPGLTGPDQASCLERFTADHDNMRAILDWAADAGEDELLLRLTGASFRFWYLRGLLGEARARLETALATQSSKPSLRERVLFGASLIAYRQGDVAFARAYANERLDLCRELGDPALVASAYIGVGLGAALDGDLSLAGAAFDRARAHAAEAGDTWAGAIATMNLSDVALLEEDLERAGNLAAEATSTFRGLGDDAMVSKALSIVGIVEVERGRLDRARRTFEDGLRLAIELDDSESLIWHLQGLAAVAALQGNVESATRMWGVGDAVRDKTGFAPQSTEQLLVKHMRELVDGEAVRVAHARAGSMTREEAVAYALESRGWRRDERQPTASAGG